VTPNTEGWSEAEMYVTQELKRLSGEVSGLRETVTNLRVEVAQKGAIWGAVSGASVAVFGWLLKR